MGCFVVGIVDCYPRMLTYGEKMFGNSMIWVKDLGEVVCPSIIWILHIVAVGFMGVSCYGLVFVETFLFFEAISGVYDAVDGICKNIFHLSRFWFVVVGINAHRFKHIEGRIEYIYSLSVFWYGQCHVTNI